MTQRSQYMLLGTILTIIVIATLLIIGVTTPFGQTNAFAKEDPTEIPTLESRPTRIEESPEAIVSESRIADDPPPTPIEKNVQQTNENAALCTETPIDEIVSQINPNEEKKHFGNRQWIRIIRTDHIPQEHRGNHYKDEMPIEDIFPDDISISEEWMHINPSGIYDKGFQITRRPNGDILQETVFYDTAWHNLTLGIEFQRSNHTVELPTQHALTAIYQTQQQSNAQIEGKCVVSPSSNQYHATLNSQYAQAMQFALLPEEKIAGERMEYQFDLDTQRLLKQTSTYITDEGDEIFASSSQFSMIETYTELPDEMEKVHSGYLSRIGDEK